MKKKLAHSVTAHPAVMNSHAIWHTLERAIAIGCCIQEQGGAAHFLPRAPLRWTLIRLGAKEGKGSRQKDSFVLK